MPRISPILVLLLLTTAAASAQRPVQTVRGSVRDAVSGTPVPSATVIVEGTTPSRAARCASDGTFTIADVPVGRYDIRITSIGYEPLVVNEVVVSSSRECIVEAQMREVALELGDVVVRPRQSKVAPLNTMSSVSTRALSVEEASRYAGGFDDPARLASSFAGVATGLENNGIVVRGNAPKSLLWRFEGVEIPNPNHFADLGTFGGGGLTALSSNLLASSDFSTGAFAAEYGNALSGVFDIAMRRGNGARAEHTASVGAIGVDVASEGPLTSDGSYLFNYRYSTLSLIAPLLPDDVGGITYQDLAWKVDLGAGESSRLAWWGLGLIDRSGGSPLEDTAAWRYRHHRFEEDVRQRMGASGLSHTILLGSSALLRSTVAANASTLSLASDELAREGDGEPWRLAPSSRIENTAVNYIAQTRFEGKLGDGHDNHSGATVTLMTYDMAIERAPEARAPLASVADEKGSALLASAFTSSQLRFGEALTATLGVHAQHFTLNGETTVEPRAALGLALGASQTVSLGYGLHSRIERLPTYFAGTDGARPNEELRATKAHHLVAGYELAIGGSMRLKAEPYYQALYDVPVVRGTSRSAINAAGDWFSRDAYVNEGAGRNVGLDLTLERFMSDGWYFLASGSLFSSRYRGGDGVWRSTRYDRGYVVNLLGGAEWLVGSDDQNMLTVSGRLTLQGGNRTTPYDLDASREAGAVVLDESRAFEGRLPAVAYLHASIGYRINAASHAWVIALNVINATGALEYHGWRYDERAGAVELAGERLVVPNLSVKLEL